MMALLHDRSSTIDSSHDKASINCGLFKHQFFGFFTFKIFDLQFNLRELLAAANIAFMDITSLLTDANLLSIWQMIFSQLTISWRSLGLKLSSPYHDMIKGKEMIRTEKDREMNERIKQDFSALIANYWTKLGWPALHERIVGYKELGV